MLWDPWGAVNSAKNKSRSDSHWTTQPEISVTDVSKSTAYHKHIPCLLKNQSVSARTLIVTVHFKSHKKLKQFIGIFVDEGGDSHSQHNVL